ncbi:MAG: PAS domain S-box protein [Rubrobacter sp.]|nr:PAS domain S-box protein [Rubrobacter sp.]
MEDKPHTNVERLLSIVAIQQEIATAKLVLGAVMELVAERMPALAGADGAAVELVEGDELVYRAASGMLASHLGMRLKIDASISGLSIRTGQLLRSDDTEADERVDREVCKKIGARSMIVVPLDHDRATVGVLKVSSAQPGAFGEEEVYTLQLMTALIAAGMSHTAQFEAEQTLLEERTRTLEQIQHSEEHLRAILEQSAVGISETDLYGRFVLVNQRYCEITGYSREELMGLRMQDITHPDDLPENLGLLERMSEEGKEFTAEKRYVRKDGSVVWASISVSPRWDGSDSPVYAVAVVQDITRRKIREAHAAFLEEVMEATGRCSAGEILQTAGAKIGAYLGLSNCLSIDVDERRDEGLVESVWNADDAPRAPRTLRLSDYASEEFYRASRAGESCAVSDAEADARANARECRAMDIRSFVTVPFHADGEWRYSLTVCDSRPRDWREDEVQLVREFSDRIFPRLERARAEEELRESQERLSIAVEAARMGVWDLDLTQGHYSVRSPRHDEIFGYSEPQSEWGGEDAKRHMLEEDRETFDAAYIRARRTGDLEFEARVRWPDGDIH